MPFGVTTPMFCSGDEVLICYGAKPAEEWLFLYGFLPKDALPTPARITVRPAAAALLPGPVLPPPTPLPPPPPALTSVNITAGSLGRLGPGAPDRRGALRRLTLTCHADLPPAQPTMFKHSSSTETPAEMIVWED